MKNQEKWNQTLVVLFSPARRTWRRHKAVRKLLKLKRQEYFAGKKRFDPPCSGPSFI